MADDGFDLSPGAEPFWPGRGCAAEVCPSALGSDAKLREVAPPPYLPIAVGTSPCTLQVPASTCNLT